MPQEPKAPQSIPADLPMYTASALGFQATPWLLRVLFGEVGAADPMAGPGTAVPQVFRLAVGLPWPLAKVLHEFLGATLAAYEEHEGKIVMPKSVEKTVKDALVQLKTSKPTS